MRFVINGFIFNFGRENDFIKIVQLSISERIEIY